MVGTMNRSIAAMSGAWGMLKDIAPQTKRVAFIANPKVTAYYYFPRTAQQLARSL
jgi:hypothetical protein